MQSLKFILNAEINGKELLYFVQTDVWANPNNALPFKKGKNLFYCCATLDINFLVECVFMRV